MTKRQDQTKQPKRSSDEPLTPPESPDPVEISKSAARLTSEEIESALLSGEHSGLLEDYFGETEYQELSTLAREAAAKSMRGGPRVLIIPGIMGSKLGIETHLLWDDVIWMDPVDIAKGDLMDLSLDHTDSNIESLGVILLAYLKLKLRLKLAGYDVDFYHYDWRKSLKLLGQQLVQYLQKERAGQVHIVAHSMGGLVTRSAIAQNAPAIRRVVMLGTPNHGSFVPVQAFRGVYSIIRKVAFLDVRHSVEELCERVFSSLPGLYEMLPWREKYDRLDLYDMATWPTLGPGPRPERLKAAPAVQQLLAAADDRFFLIAGVNQETVVGLSKEGDEFSYEMSVEGDGTVPLAFARISGAKTYYIEESHGSLPNNRQVAKAVDDILATGATQVLSESWEPTRAVVTRQVGDQALEAEPPYEGVDGRALSLREQRQLLEELISLDSNDQSDLIRSDAVVTQPSGYDEFDNLVISRQRQHRMEIRLAHGSITDVEAHAYVLGLFRNVTPSGAARVIDQMLDGAVSEFVDRRMFNANVGEVSIIPTNRRRLPAELVLFAGLGPFDQFDNQVLALVAENVLRTFLKSKVEDFATVLFGGASGHNPSDTLKHLLKGFFRGLQETDHNHRFRSVTLCETNLERYQAIKQELYRLSGTALFKDVEITIDEIPMPPPMAPRLSGSGIRQRPSREPVYLIVRQERLDDTRLSFESSILTAGSKATVLKGGREISVADLKKVLDKMESRNFTIGRLDQFGHDLGMLLLAPEILTVLERYPQYHLVVVHDAPSSRIPWETLRAGSHFPAAEGGLSRRYMAGDLSIAKWLESRRHGPTLDVLLVVNPTEDLSGAEEEGQRIEQLFGKLTSAVRLHTLRGTEARKNALLERFGSGDYDVLHYAGHAFFDPANPARSGILCHGGTVLSGAELAGNGNLPSLVFFNACEAGRLRRAAADKKNRQLDMDQRITRSVGLAEAFLRGGVANYIGTYWPVGDAAAMRFSEAFYGELLQGKPIGDSLLEGRKAVQALKSVDWADYILYGNHNFVLKEEPGS